MNLGNPASDDFLRHQFDFLNTNSQTELLSYDYNQPVMVSSPTCQLSETDSFLPFENSTQTSATYHQMSLPNPNIFSKATESREISPFMPLSQEAACGLAVCSSASQPLPILSPPLGLDYYTLETSRAAPLIGSKRSLPIMNRGEMSQNAHEIKESLLGFEGRGGPGFMHDFNVLPNTTSKYPIESFHETGESSSHLSWDMRTRSSSSRSPSYDQSSKFSPHNLPARSGAYQPEKSTTSGKKQNSPQVSGSRDYQTNQKRVGSLIDIHHLTNHVPRRRLTVEQEQILLRRFAVQEYLSKREMEELAEKLKIPTSQLRTWFGNRRSKLKAAARQKAKMEAGMGHLTDAELRSLNKRS
ncbi:homeobox [Puccinia graminis f. sp. tritici]|uniref:Homeobox n=1 Tax=Puccinia graminis f. sp. tritici TaxID=56615 RepID=A0A5B0Q7A1_PUCGR|nr:homeobox [Puccinia graminis f. sp. tritici]